MTKEGLLELNKEIQVDQGSEAESTTERLQEAGRGCKIEHKHRGNKQKEPGGSVP